jgi:enoyl-CoA hydratase/carnithine racemase
VHRVVAAVNGICQAGGLLIAMLDDICVASDRATFRVPELLCGIPDATYAAVLPAPMARMHIERMVNDRYGLIDYQTMFWALEESPEPRQGMQAFMEKQAPNWVPEGLPGEDPGS